MEICRCLTRVLHFVPQEASRSQSQEPKGEVLLLLLPYVLASVSSEANVVRENGCQVLDTLGQLLGNTHGPEEKKLKKTINAFLEVSLQCYKEIDF